jgi:hypothetical protein
MEAFMDSRFFRYLAVTALTALTLPSSAYVIGNGGLTGDIYSQQGASTHRSFAPFFEEVFDDATLIYLPEESTLSANLSLFGSAIKQQMYVSSISVSKTIIPSAAPPSILATATAPGYYTFEPLAAGYYYFQVHGQVLLDNNIDYQIRPDWSLGYDMTVFAAPMASAAPDASSVILTSLGLIGVMWRARRLPSASGVR